MMSVEPTEEMIEALQRAVEASFDHYERCLRLHMYGPRGLRYVRRGASLATLRRRVRYGGRKGRRAARRLAGR